MEEISENIKEQYRETRYKVIEDLVAAMTESPYCNEILTETIQKQNDFWEGDQLVKYICG
eukprot:CAMPEP_0201281752 /NCGR_PEP_ID=MMETSP1317-20130820/3969_1 /ASSEMBLY_ACC=CAM_ASM_000770 /TAXON_ID=187299 /ORGANISM="Undescribed Undescribed, Strain Undescribed" /LENGTH=59 /DNA_ID=CAMNT_0047592523 /DNA_START=262 /DNA_END=441 /DNA_ORIENTATION=-